ncbi:amidohydrolase [Aminipila terrae]|uniref:Amidohydrolase family protein n=1 Tax=Aminipila terrae TaxID=2697030 RepID=A0A6P1MC63_9FIRM|nr:amidohydrolase [Aminipila terrae]QHI71441.1 amidohydrolase family protein [Aminipila terrae]
MNSIVNGHILTMDGEDFKDGFIIVENGKIMNIGDMKEYDYDVVNTIDVKGKYLLPGLVDCHTHLGMINDSASKSNSDSNEICGAIQPQLHVLDAINIFDRGFEDARSSGVTSVVVCPGSANVIGGQCTAIKTSPGDCVDQMIIKKTVAVKAALGENTKNMYRAKDKAPATRMGIAALLRQTLIETKIYKKKKEKDDTLYDFRLESLLSVMDKKLPLKIHAHRSDDICTALRIAKEFNIAISLEHCTEGLRVAQQLKDAEVPIVVGPLLIARGKDELKNQSVFTPKAFYDAGLKFAIMSDHPCMPVNFLLLSAIVASRYGLPEKEALKAVTIYPAEIAGIDHKVGSLSLGKDADILVFDGDPMDARSNVVSTFIDGKLVYSIR